MRSVTEYLEKAAEFDELARSTSEPALKERYADVAKSYRIWRWCRNGWIDGSVKPEQPP